ncbi:MAG TPA: N-acetyltransferase [Actinophytocola sp.]|jgi:ribosomal protein S18 acetylase RimI-like enzyme|nr:N-acetyltransferase [Actinophytocola sp.]
MIELRWPSAMSDELVAQVHRVLHAVVAAGGAVGYLTPPPLPVTEAWLSETLGAVRAGDAALALGVVDGRVEATGQWRRGPRPIFEHAADVTKVMVHPAARGLGLGGLVVSGLVERARAAGLETLTLGVRGNNHGTIDLYRSLGFLEWGRLPNVIEVGADRYDDVRLYLALSRAPGVRLRGSSPGGPGSSPARP